MAFSGNLEGAADADRRAVETFGDTLAGSDRPLLIASGVLGLAPGRVATETDGRGPDPAAAALGGGPRPDSARRRWRSRSLPAESARPPFGSPRRVMATETMASWRPWSASPGKGASPATSATGPTVGPPRTASTWPISSTWRWKRPRAGSALHAVAEAGVHDPPGRRGDRTTPRHPCGRYPS